MKCPQCGNTMNAYKEIRGIMAEMGITKEELKEEIHATIDSYVRNALSVDATKYIRESAVSIVRSEIANSGYNRPSKVQGVLNECLHDMVMQELSGFKISVSVNVQEGVQDGNH